MSKLAAFQAEVAIASETMADMTEVQRGGGGRLLPEGYAFGRLVEYVELGSQPQEYNGQKKDPKPEARIAFALWGQGYQNEDGTPYIMRMYPFTLDRNEKAGAFLLFKSLNWKGTAKNFGQLLGEAFLVKIVHEPKSKADQTKVSRIDKKGFLPPLDPVTKMPYGIPPARDEDLQLFLWDRPNLGAWNALFVDGKFDDGRSKNFTQETIVGATNFAGSALEALLLGNGATVPAAAAEPVQATPALPSAPAVPAAPAVEVPAPLAPATSAAVPLHVAAPLVPTVPSAPPAGIPTTTSPSSLPSIPALPSLPVIPS